MAAPISSAPPPAYPPYNSPGPGPQQPPYQIQVVQAPAAVVVPEVEHNDSSSNICCGGEEEDKKGQSEEEEEDLEPGSGPGGVPQKYFRVSQYNYSKKNCNLKYLQISRFHCPSGT